jgi:O-antigen/teichoic acid export membrane protein
MTDLEPHRIIENTAAYAAGNIFSRLFDILTIFLLARYLGVVDFGKFSFALAYVGLFSVVIDLGFNLILVRELSKSPERGARLYGSGVSLNFVFAGLGALAAVGSILVLRYPPEIKVLVALASLNLFVSFRMPSFKDVFEVPLVAGLKLKYSAAAAAANRILTLPVMVGAMLLKAPLGLLVLIYALVSLPSFLLLLHYSRAVVRPAFRAEWPDWLFLFKEGLPLGLAGILAIVYAQADTLLISKFWTMKEVSFYSAARRVMEPLQLLPAAFGLSILPVISEMFVRRKDEIVRVYRKSLLYILLLALPIAAFLFCFSRPVVTLLFGADFREAARALALLSFSLPFVFISHMSAVVFIAVHKQKTAAFIWLAALSLYFSLDFVFIPRQAYVGASGVRLATAVLVSVLSVVWVVRYLGPMDLGFLAGLGLLAAPLMAGARLLFDSPVRSFLFFIVLFTAGLFAFRIVRGADVRLLGRSLRRLLGRPGRERR